MTRIGNGFIAGLEYVNRNILDYTGRCFPSSLSDIRSNLSKNIRTCAKVGVVFMNSSFGLAFAMGVVGLTTSSLCVGEDVVNLITTTILPATTNSSLVNDANMTELAFLCFKQGVNVQVNEGSFHHLMSNVSHICDQQEEVDCGLALHNTVRNFSSLEPECLDIGSSIFGMVNDFFHPGYDRDTEYPAVAIYRVEASNISGLVQGLECLQEEIFYVVNHTVGQVINFLGMKQGFCSHNSKSNLDPPKDAFCFNTSANMAYFAARAEDISEKCLVSLPHNSIFRTVPSFIEPVIVDAGNTCSKATLVFGVSSVAVLLRTTIKLLDWYHSRERHHSRSARLGLRKVTAMVLDSWLLIAASELGSSVLLSSLSNPCNPVDEDTKKVIVASTVLYGVSTVSKLLKALVCKPKDEKKLLDKVVIMEMQEFDDDEAKGKETSVLVVVVMDAS
ncbi:hypothetical protein [Candidatus Clavichlamydia salmonicola]|uniref:hypothetical protein n=1 Tax=Candidatus Clavichlamydia salmonicola TaxID=469812 RepID=UPI001890FEAA|nr:hypothetical protein [Candidatus Clavichlamydia salmonicola]